MPPQERRFLTGYRKQDDNQPGLIQEDDETVWLVLPDGTRVELAGSGDVTQAELDAESAALTAAMIPRSVIDAPGDLIVGNGADSVTRLPIGANTKLLGVTSGALAYVDNSGTPGADGATGATGPAGSGGASIVEYQLDADTAVGATAIVLDRSPSTPVYVGQAIVIDAFTTEAEIRVIDSIAGTTLNLDLALEFAHTTNDFAVLVRDWVAPAEMFGLTGDGTDEWEALQRLFTEATRYSITIRGSGYTYSFGQPLLLFGGTRVDRLELSTLASFAPVDATGAAIMVGIELLPFTAAAATDIFTVPAGHETTEEWEVVNHTPVSFCAPYGETLPAPLVAGRVYYVDSVQSTTELKIRETAGGSVLNITADGAGHMLTKVNTLARVFWESLRLDLNVANLNGIMTGIQQPSWTRNLRIEMNTPATTTAIGLQLNGQLSYHDNVEINTDANCVGMTMIGAGHIVRGFNCNGVLDNDTALQISGRCMTVENLWTEQLGRACAELVGTVRGVSFGGTWLVSCSTPTVSPVLLVTGITTSYTVNQIRVTSTSQLILNDTARAATISAWDGGAGGETDQGLVFGGMRQAYSGYGPQLVDQAIANVSANYTMRHVDRVVAMDPTGGSRTVTLPSAWGWNGSIHTIKHRSASGNTVTVDPSGSETIDGSATSRVLTAWQSLTIVSNGVNWLEV